MEILNYVFILLFVIAALYALFVFAHPVVRWLVTSLAIWAALLAQIAVFGEFARQNWNLAIVIWMALATFSAASIWLAAVIGLGLGVTEATPVETEQQPAEWQEPGLEYERRTGQDPVHCQTAKDWMEVMDA